MTKKKEEMQQWPKIRLPVGEQFQQQLRRTEELLTEKVLFTDVRQSYTAGFKGQGPNIIRALNAEQLWNGPGFALRDCKENREAKQNMEKVETQCQGKYMR